MANGFIKQYFNLAKIVENKAKHDFMRLLSNCSSPHVISFD